jgi:hypothetical protein
MGITTSYSSVWDAIEQNKADAEKMKAISEGMDLLRDLYEQSEAKEQGVDKSFTMCWTQEHQAVNGIFVKIMAGRISLLSMEDLFAAARFKGYDTFGLEGICTKYGQPIPTF